MIFFRNRIRKKLIPCIEKEYSPAIKNHLIELAQTAQVSYDFIRKSAMRKFAIFCTRRNDKITFFQKKIRNCHEAVRKELYVVIIELLLGNRRGLRNCHLNTLEQAVNANKSVSYDLFKGIKVKVDQNQVIIKRTNS